MITEGELVYFPPDDGGVRAVRRDEIEGALIMEVLAQDMGSPQEMSHYRDRIRATTEARAKTLDIRLTALNRQLGESSREPAPPATAGSDPAENEKLCPLLDPAWSPEKPTAVTAYGGTRHAAPDCSIQMWSGEDPRLGPLSVWLWIARVGVDACAAERAVYAHDSRNLPDGMSEVRGLGEETWNWGSRQTERHPRYQAVSFCRGPYVAGGYSDGGPPQQWAKAVERLRDIDHSLARLSDPVRAEAALVNALSDDAVRWLTGAVMGSTVTGPGELDTRRAARLLSPPERAAREDDPRVNMLASAFALTEIQDSQGQPVFPSVAGVMPVILALARNSMHDLGALPALRRFTWLVAGMDLRARRAPPTASPADPGPMLP